MKVWWCLEHETSGHPPRCWKQLMTHAYGDCRQVEMQLVPADARVVWWCEEHESSIEDPGDLHICIRAAWVDDGSPFTDCRIAGAWLIPNTQPEEPPKDPWDYDP